MLQNHRTHLISSFIATASIIAFASACSSSDAAGEETVVPDEPCTDCAEPPAKPDGAPAGDGPGTVLAISKLYLGDTDRNGVPSPNAWKEYGYDLDGYNSNKNSTTHCKVNTGGSKAAIQTDGNDGIDNSFGVNILPVIKSLADNASELINENLEEGSFTIILGIDGVGGGKDYMNLPAALYAGADLAELSGAPAQWNGEDEWPIFCELMKDCKESGTLQVDQGATSKVQFPNSFMANGTWVSGSKETVGLSLSIQGFSLDIDINQAVITADLSGDPPNMASNGIIAGVIEAAKLNDSIVQLAGRFSTSFCDPENPAVQSVQGAITAAADIMKDGTQDPTTECDGISIGLGFDMKQVKLGEVLDRTPAGDDPCADQ